MNTVNRDENSKDLKKMLECKHIVTEMKNAFGGIISKVYMTEEGVSEFENMIVETCKTEKQREERLKKTPQNPTSRNNGTATKGITYT